MKELIQRFARVPAVSSREENFCNLLKAELKDHVDSMKEDALGNLIVFKKGERSPAQKVLLDVHMDENGVMVAGFTEDGFLRFQTVGTVDRRTLIGKRVRMGEEKLPGVVGMKPIHLSSRDERKKLPKTDDLYIDIGAKDKKEAQSKLSLGDVGWFEAESRPFGEDFWKGTGLSSRVCCAAAVKLLQEPLPVDLTVVFGAQELVGTRGAYGAAFSQRPDVVLCLDGVASGVLREKGEDGQPELGKGLVLPVMDRFAIYDRSLFGQLRSLAQKAGVDWQLEAKAPSAGNARAYQRVGGGARTAGMALPVRYLHSPVEVVSLGDAEQMLTLTRLFLQNTL